MTRRLAPERAETAPERGEAPCPPFEKGVLERLPIWRLGLCVAIVGMLLTLPALWSGFAQDDYFFLMVFKGCPGLEFLDYTPLETYSFSKGDPALQERLMERGFLPWWTVDGWKINFWRPVSALSSWIDYRLFGESAWPMHLHSLLLYGLLIFMAAVMYRRFIPSRYAAGLAALLFAIDSGHAIPVTWLSMRNALLALFFGLLVLYAHDRWRKARGTEGGIQSWFPHGLLALLWLVLGLLSGESAVAVGAYLFAYALFLDPAVQKTGSNKSVRRFVASVGALLPYLIVVVLWRVVYSTLGYGTEGSGLYIDPIHSPVEFLHQLPSHLAVLLLGVFALPDAGLWGLAPAPLNYIHLAGAVLFLLVAGWLIMPLLRQRAEARFLMVGALLAAVPASSTIPMDRLMTFSSFGALGLVALFLSGYRSRDEWVTTSPRRAPFFRILLLILIIAHLVVSPIGLSTGTQQIVFMNRVLMNSNPSIPKDLPESTRIVALNIPIDLLGTSLPIYRSAREETVPEHWWWLYAGVQALSVERIDARTLLLRPDGGYHRPPWSQVFRFPPTDPIEAGERFALDGVAIEVLAVSPDGRPTEVRFEFDKSLEDPSFYFVTWRNGAYLPITLPALGETTVISATKLETLLPIVLGQERP